MSLAGISSTSALSQARAYSLIFSSVAMIFRSFQAPCNQERESVRRQLSTTLAT